MPSLTFKRGERLKSTKIISHLFSGDCPSVKAYPLIAVYTILEKEQPDYPVQIAFSVPKRKFKSAVKRNAIRRKLKEAYRLQKNEFYQELGLSDHQQLAIMIIYITNDTLEFNKLDTAIRKVISKLKKELH